MGSSFPTRSSLILTAALSASALAYSSPEGGSTAGALGFAELDSVHVGMRAGQFGRVRPSAVPGGYGWYSDSLPGFEVGYSFDGTTFREGQPPPSRSRLRYIQISPSGPDASLEGLWSRVVAGLGEPSQCFILSGGSRHEGGYAQWQESEVLLAVVSVRTASGDETEVPKQPPTILIGDSWLLELDFFPRTPTPCDDLKSDTESELSASGG